MSVGVSVGRNHLPSDLDFPFGAGNHPIPAFAPYPQAPDLVLVEAALVPFLFPSPIRRVMAKELGLALEKWCWEVAQCRNDGEGWVQSHRG